MRMNNYLRKKYTDICRKYRYNLKLEGEDKARLADQFYAQKQLMECIFPYNAEELQALKEKAFEQADKDFKYYNTFNG